VWSPEAITERWGRQAQTNPPKSDTDGQQQKLRELTFATVEKVRINLGCYLGCGTKPKLLLQVMAVKLPFYSIHDYGQLRQIPIVPLCHTGLFKCFAKRENHFFATINWNNSGCCK
jgi:hypothetical protein